MAIVTCTDIGILRKGVDQTPFFMSARQELLAGGLKPTVWADYFVVKRPNATYFITIRKSLISVEGTARFTTKFASKVVDFCTK